MSGGGGGRWDGPIHKASLQGRLADVQGLLWSDFSLLESRGFNGVKPIHCAVRRGHHHVLRYLITQGALLDSTDHGGWTILHHAAAGNQSSMLLHLLTQVGPPYPCIDAKAADGSTPLLIALLEGHLAVVRLLLQAGADPTLSNHRGQSPLNLSSISTSTSSSSESRRRPLLSSLYFGQKFIEINRMIQGSSYQRVQLIRLRQGPWGAQRMMEGGGGWDDIDLHHASPGGDHGGEEEMGVLEGLVRLTNDDIFGECLRFLDHAQAEKAAAGEEERMGGMTLLDHPPPPPVRHDDVIVVPVMMMQQQEA